MINQDKQKILNQLPQKRYELFLEDINNIEEFIPRLRHINFQLFNEYENYNQPLCLSTRLPRSRADEKRFEMAQSFLGAIVKLNRIVDVYPLKQLPLYLQLLEESVQSHFLWDFPYKETWFKDYEVDLLNQCVSRIQRCLCHEELLDELKRINRQELMQTRSVRSYIGDLFSIYARLQVLRIDLHYHQGLDVRFADIHRHRKLMIRYLKEKHLGHAHVGFVWKLEYGLRKSYHLHMMIFMDGSKVQQSALHGKLICEYWNETVTKGFGTSFNCNGKMDKYSDCGIGTVDYYNREKITSLLKACHYLTKYDPYIDIMLQHEARMELQAGNDELSKQIANGRVFGKGLLPDISVKRGRHRSFSSEVAKVIEDILIEQRRNRTD